MSTAKKSSKAHPPVFHKFDPSNPYDFDVFITAVNLGKAHREDAEEVMRNFCDTMARDQAPDRTTLEFIAAAFDRYLNHNISLSKSFGIEQRGRGRAPSKAIERKHVHAAFVAVCKHILEGMNETLAKDETGNALGLGKTQMQQAWNRYRQYAAFELFHRLISDDKLKASKQSRSRLIAFIKQTPIVPLSITAFIGGKKWHPHMGVAKCG